MNEEDKKKIEDICFNCKTFISENKTSFNKCRDLTLYICKSCWTGADSEDIKKWTKNIESMYLHEIIYNQYINKILHLLDLEDRQMKKKRLSKKDLV